MGAVGRREDELGTLNFITSKKRKRAATLINDGVVVSLALSVATAVASESASEAQAEFFNKIVFLFVGGFYTTQEGMKDIGYVGNVPLQKFEGPPPEIRRRLGV